MYRWEGSFMGGNPQIGNAEQLRGDDSIHVPERPCMAFNLK